MPGQNHRQTKCLSGQMVRLRTDILNNSLNARLLHFEMSFISNTVKFNIIIAVSLYKLELTKSPHFLEFLLNIVD